MPFLFNFLCTPLNLSVSEKRVKCNLWLHFISNAVEVPEVGVCDMVMDLQDCSVTTTDGLGRICLTNRKKCSNMQCFAIPFKPLGPKMAKTVSCSNTTLETHGRPEAGRGLVRDGVAPVEVGLHPLPCFDR